jgi:hypothetical protein
MCHYQGFWGIIGIRGVTSVGSNDEFFQGGVGLQEATDLFEIDKSAGYVVFK